MASAEHYLDYGSAILSGLEYLLEKYPETFVIGQGLWSPWYVGNSMTNLDKKFGSHRIIDTPVSESACTGAAIGASLCGMRPIVVHPRIDFMLYAMDALVNQAAKWSHMFGGQSGPSVTIRAIINRGGEQGAQHSQALHAWFSHIPGLRVVMPSSVRDARDLLVASALCDDPVVFIDDRWLYNNEETIGEIAELDLRLQGPARVAAGDDITIVGVGYGTHVAKQAGHEVAKEGITCDIIDMRVLSPLNIEVIVESVRTTRALLVVDPGTKTSGYAAEIITSVMERIEPNVLIKKPLRTTLPDTPAPTARNLEQHYYFGSNDVVESITNLLRNG